MKSERRHELKTNTLAEALAHLPNEGRRRLVTTISIALAGVLIFCLVRYRMTASANRLSTARDNLAVARDEIDELRQLAVMALDPSQPKEIATDINARLDSVMAAEGDSNPGMAAEVLLARGDVNWEMAGIASATTQPSPGQQTASDLLQNAEQSYNQVISGYPQQTLAVTAARFGLAAIAEDHQDWDTARKLYQAVIDGTQAGDIMQAVAQQRIASMEGLNQPPVIGEIVPPSTQPTTRGAILPLGPN
ncbi:MAG: hypothetical protein ABSH22_09965 [Tepidisphaeraceae bacterium]|jgi:hypothetical protein